MPVNPFVSNPFSRGRELKLQTVPDAPETHEPRKPPRTYLSQGGGGISLDGLLGSGGKARRPIVQEKVVYREAPQDDGDSDDSAPRYGR